MLSLYLEKSFMRQKKAEIPIESLHLNSKLPLTVPTYIMHAVFMWISDTILICWYQLGTPVLKYDKKQFQNKF